MFGDVLLCCHLYPDRDRQVVLVGKVPTLVVVSLIRPIRRFF